ncbi:hypothetical protein GCM10023074_68610 [Microbispora amethystogenes]|uniref:Uncharacterized protein n=1 Tax=Microbispora amethystogenes TaxID=1427754 RepID=A0ABQ4FNQ0_9ACTN|nr:hypothetical protein Mam01_66050 [Microbispora amethystogenes]
MDEAVAVLPCDSRMGAAAAGADTAVAATTQATTRTSALSTAVRARRVGWIVERFRMMAISLRGVNGDEP